MNPNFKEINAKEQMAREDSVFHYYQKLIKLRHEKDIIVYGEYKLLFANHPSLYVYSRTLGEEKLLVVCNFSKENQTMELPDDFQGKDVQVLISNYKDIEVRKELILRPYEAIVIMN